MKNFSIFFIFVICLLKSNSQININIGTSRDYPTLTAALNYLQTITINQPYQLLLNGDYNSSLENFPIVFNKQNGASQINTITIKPAPGVSTFINGRVVGGGVIEFRDCNYYILDGSNERGGTSQNLSIVNTTTSFIDYSVASNNQSNSVIWVRSEYLGSGCQYNIIKNCNIKGQNFLGNVSVLNGILFGGKPWVSNPNDTITLNKHGRFNNNKVINNNISNVKFSGISLVGNFYSNIDQNNEISYNTIGSELELGSGPSFFGIFAANQQNISIVENEIQNMNHTSNDLVADIFGSTTFGMGLYNITQSTIAGNEIHQINLSNNHYGSGLYYNQNALLLKDTNIQTSNIFYNQVIRDINFSGNCLDSFAVSGFDYNNGRRDTIIYNSVSLVGPFGISQKKTAVFKYTNSLKLNSLQFDNIVLSNNIFYLQNLDDGGLNYVLSINGNLPPSMLTANNFSSNALFDSITYLRNNFFAEVNQTSYKTPLSFFSIFPNYNAYVGGISFIHPKNDLHIVYQSTIYQNAMGKYFPNILYDKDALFRQNPKSIGAYNFQLNPAPTLYSVTPALIQTKDTLWLTGSNIKFVVIKSFPDSFIISNTNFVSINPLPSNDTMYGLVIPYNLKNDVYEVRAANYYLSTITNPLLIRIYNFSPDSVYVKSWGFNDWLQYNVVESQPNIVHIGFGLNHRLLLDKNGRVFGTGNNGSQQLNFTSTPLISVTGGLNYSLGLTQNLGLVVGNGLPFNPDNTTFDLILNFAAGQSHINYPTINYNYLATGLNNFNQLASSSNYSNAVRTGAGGFTSYILKNDGTVDAYGLNNFGQATIPPNLNQNISRVVGGNTHASFLKNDGSLFQIGNNSGQLNMPNLVNIQYINNGAYFSNALDINGNYYAWGKDNYDTILGYPLNPFYNYATFRGVVSQFPTLTDVVALGEGTPLLYNSVIQRLFILTSAINGFIEPKKYFKWGDSVQILFSPKPGFVLDSIYINGIISPTKINQSSYTFKNTISSRTILVKFRLRDSLNIVQEPSSAKIVLCANTANTITSISARAQASKKNNTSILTMFQWYKTTSKRNMGGVLVSEGTLNSFDTTLFYYPKADVVPDSSFYYVIFYNNQGSTLTSLTSGAVVVYSNNLSWTINGDSLQKCLSFNSTGLVRILFSNPNNINYVPSVYQINPLDNSVLELNIFQDPSNSNFYYSGTFISRVSSKLNFLLRINYPNGCQDTSAIFNLQWYSPINIDTQNFYSQTLCKGSTPIPLIVRSNIDTNFGQFTWYASPTKSYKDAFVAVNKNVTVFSPNTLPQKNSPDSLWYFVVVNDKFISCANDTSPFSGKIFVNYPKIISQSNVTTTYNCVGNNIIPLFVSVNNAWKSNVTYQWFIVRDTMFSSKTVIGNDSTLSIQFSTIDTFTFFSIVSSKPNSSCPNLSDTSFLNGPFIVISNPGIINTLNDTTYCQNNNLTKVEIQSNSSQNSLLTYNWYQHNNRNYNGNLIYSSTNNVFPIPNKLGIAYYYVIVTLNSNTVCNSTSNIFKNIILTKPSFQDVKLNYNVVNQMCILETNATYFQFKLPAFNYQIKFYENDVPEYNGNQLYLNQVSVDSFYSNLITFSSPTNKYYYFTINSFNGCYDTSTFYQLQWYRRIAIASENLGGRTYCKGQPANALSINFGPLININNLNYKWFGNSNPSYNYAVQISNTNSNNFIPSTIPSPLILDTMYYYLVIQDNDYACAIDTSSVSGPIIIRSYGISKNLLINKNVACLNANFDTLKFAPRNDRSVNLAYAWYKNLSPEFMNSQLTAVTDSFLIPSSNQVGTFYYYCISTIQNGICIGVKDTSYFSLPITTYPIPLAADFSNIRTCNKANNAFLKAEVQYPNNDGPLTYFWYANSISSEIGQKLVRINYADTIDITSLSTTYPYYLKFVVSNQIGCRDSSSFSEIDLLPSPLSSGVKLEVNNTIDPLCLPINTSFIFPVKVINPNSLALRTLMYSSNQKNYIGQNIPLNLINVINDSINYNSSSLNQNFIQNKYLFFVLTDTLNNCSDTTSFFNLQFFKPINITSLQMSGAFYCRYDPAEPLIISPNQTSSDKFQYYWYSTTDSTYINARLIFVGDDSLFIPPTTKQTADTMYYFCIVKNTLYSCSYATSDISGRIVISPPLFTYSIYQNDKIGCVSQPLDTLIVHIPFSYQTKTKTQWYRNTLPRYNNATLVSINDTMYIPTSNIADTFYYFSITSINTCPNFKDTSYISGAAVFYLRPIFVQNIIDKEFCIYDKNAILEPLVYYLGSDNLNYYWYVNDSRRDTFGSMKINLANQLSLIVPTANVDTNYYFLNVVNSVGCSVLSNIAQTIIRPNPYIEGSYTIINDSLTQLCRGKNDSNFINIKLVQPPQATNYIANLYYNTQKTLNGLPLQTIPNGTNMFYSEKFVQPLNTIYYFYNELTNIYGCSNFDSLYQVSWFKFFNSNIITDGPLLSCRNNDFSALKVSAGSNDLQRNKYQWYGLYSPTDYALNRGFIISGAKDSFFMPPSNNIFPIKDSMYYYVIIYDSLQNCKSDTLGPSKLVQIIYPKIDSTSNTATSVACVGQNHQTIISNINPNWTYNLNYSWYKSLTPEHSINDVLISSSFNNSYTPFFNFPDSSYFYVVVTGTIVPTPPYCTILPTDTSISTAVFITYPYPAFLSNLVDTVVCNRGSKDINANVSYSFNDALRYDWYYNINQSNLNPILAQSSTNSGFRIPNISGNFYYFVVVSNSIGCLTQSNIARITIIPSPLVEIDTLFFTPSILQTTYLKVRASGANNFYWYPERFAIPNISYPYQDVFLRPDTTTLFTVVGVNGVGCTDTARLKVLVYDTLLDIYPTSIITPNNDGINDTWEIKNIDFFPENTIFIYSERNDVVINFSNFHSKTNWGGKNRYGNKLNNGQYFYIIDLYKNGSYYRTKKGSFLIRND